MVLRQRRRPTATAIKDVVQDMDVFVKVEQSFVEQSTLGAIVCILVWVLASFLVWSEVRLFLRPPPKFRFIPDKELSGNVVLHIDITVASRCDNIGADVLDSTHQSTLGFGRLIEEPAWFELDQAQRKHFDLYKTFNEYLREEYHHLRNHLPWSSSPSMGGESRGGTVPKRLQSPKGEPDACRLHGSLNLNKVAGNLHITAGKSLHLPGGLHAHLVPFTGEMDGAIYNFSHRIDTFYFSSKGSKGYDGAHGGMVQPLQGDEKVTTSGEAQRVYQCHVAVQRGLCPDETIDASHPTDHGFFLHMLDNNSDEEDARYQYIIQIVPTDVYGLTGRWPTFQYSVKEHFRRVEASLGGPKSPGIVFMYDFSAFKVVVNQDREAFWMFLVRLCAGVGGLFSTAQLLCHILASVYEQVFPNGGKDDLKASPVDSGDRTDSSIRCN